MFSRLYKNSLNLLVTKYSHIHGYKHIAYADDHLTVVALVYRVDEVSSRIKTDIANVALTCRLLLDSATKDTGCGINAANS